VILKSGAAILLRLRLREERIVAIDFIVGTVCFHARSVGHVSSIRPRQGQGGGPIRRAGRQGSDNAAADRMARPC
jgi:hypothetical protein